VGVEVGAVNVWLIGATIVLAGIAPCAFVVVRAGLLDALMALELVATLATLSLVLIAEGLHRSSYFGVPLVLAFLTFVGGLIYVRFLADRRL
jgi:multisubunit Na+/H+ antiporter MnhF subunit